MCFLDIVLIRELFLSSNLVPIKILADILFLSNISKTGSIFSVSYAKKIKLTSFLFLFPLIINLS
jgi:hypothetical protein